jgi:uncharacterized membrane protein
MKAKTLLLVLVTSGILVAGCRHYQSAGRSEHRHSEAHLHHGLQHVAKKLNLTDEQRSKLDALLTDMKGLRNTTETRERLRQLFVAEFAKPTPDATTLQAELYRELELVQTAASNIIQQAVVFHASLDASQRTELTRQMSTAGRSDRIGFCR